MLAKDKRQLHEHGFCTLTNVLDGDMLRRLKEYFSQGLLPGASHENFGESGGFIALDFKEPLISELLTWPKTLTSLQEMGFSDVKLHSFYVSAKPRGSKELPWHSDLFYNYESREPAELLLIYYLQNTTPENGCLRVVPGSHLWPRRKLQQQSGDSSRRSDEVDVLLNAGDLFIGDRRILHSTHANDTNQWRSCVTIAYAPKFKNLSLSIKKTIVSNNCLPPPEWRKDPDKHGIDRQLASILPAMQ